MSASDRVWDWDWAIWDHALRNQTGAAAPRRSIRTGMRKSRIRNSEVFFMEAFFREACRSPTGDRRDQPERAPP
jgi:hypothetical protein